MIQKRESDNEWLLKDDPMGRFTPNDCMLQTYTIRGPKLCSLYCLHDIFVYDQGREDSGHAELDHDISWALSAKP